MKGIHSDYGVRFPTSEGYTFLEFGVAGGASLRAMLHFRDVWARSLRLDLPITVLGFDTFGGLPPEREGDAGPWQPGDFAVSIDAVERDLAPFADWRLVKGLIGETLVREREYLVSNPPVFISVDVDYYSSTVDIFENLLDLVPNGAMFYFDDASAHWFSDRFGELRAVREANEGRFGPGIGFAEYPLWIETRELRHYKQLWRFVNEAKHLSGTAEPISVPTRSKPSPL